MSAAYERARHLIDLKRYAMAEKELRRHLTEAPHDATALALLALCQLNLRAIGAALQTVKAAIHASPDLSFPYYVLAHVREALCEWTDAMEAILEAIAIDNGCPDYHAVAGRLQFSWNDWNAALRYADVGLRLSPDHPGCLEIRLIALEQMGRFDEYANTADLALAAHPDLSFAHLRQGWQKLRENKAAVAQKFFREALRIDPFTQPAREGLRQSVYTGIFGYDLLLRWVTRSACTPEAAMMFVGVWWAGVALTFASHFPDSLWTEGRWFGIAIAAFFLGRLGNYQLAFANIVLDSLLRFHPTACRSLTRQQITASNVFFAGFLSVVVLLACDRMLVPWLAEHVPFPGGRIAVNLFIILQCVGFLVGAFHYSFSDPPIDGDEEDNLENRAA